MGDGPRDPTMPSPRVNANEGNELSTALAKLERARFRGLNIAKKHSTIDGELLQWERHKLCLLNKRALAKGQREDWLNDTYRHTIVPYSKAWNLDFAAKMQERLLPEIWSMVFDHLWDFNYRPMCIRFLSASHIEPTRDANVSVTAPKHCSQNVADSAFTILSFVRDLRHADEKALRRLCEAGGLPHYLSPDFVGMGTLVEVVQSLYRVLGSLSLVVCHVDRIEEILAADPFHAGFTTATALRSLTVHCKIDRYRLAHCRVKTGCHHIIEDLAYIDAEALRHDFSALEGLARKSDFELHIQLIQRNLRLRMLEEVLSVLMDVVLSESLDYGAGVTVSWTYRGHWKAWKRPWEMDRVITDITHCLDLTTPQRWAEMREVFGVVSSLLREYW